MTQYNVIVQHVSHYSPKFVPANNIAVLILEKYPSMIFPIDRNKWYWWAGFGLDTIHYSYPDNLSDMILFYTNSRPKFQCVMELCHFQICLFSSAIPVDIQITQSRNLGSYIIFPLETKLSIFFFNLKKINGKQILKVFFVKAAKN